MLNVDSTSSPTSSASSAQHAVLDPQLVSKPGPQIHVAAASGLLLLGLVMSSGCATPVGVLETHLESLTEVYTEHVNTPAEGLTTAYNYLAENNLEVATTARDLVATLQPTEATGSATKELSRQVIQRLLPLREGLLEARGKWQRAAILDPNTADRMETIGASYVQRVQDSFDTAISSVILAAKRIAKP